MKRIIAALLLAVAGLSLSNAEIMYTGGKKTTVFIIVVPDEDQVHWYVKVIPDGEKACAKLVEGSKKIDPTAEVRCITVRDTRGT